MTQDEVAAILEPIVEALFESRDVRVDFTQEIVEVPTDGSSRKWEHTGRQTITITVDRKAKGA